MPVDDFNSGAGSMTCGAWGTIAVLPGFGSAAPQTISSVTRDGARLNMVPSTEPGTGVQCQTLTRVDFSSGTSVRVQSALNSNPDDETFLRVVLPNETSAAIAIYRDALSTLRLRFECAGTHQLESLALGSGWLKLVGNAAQDGVTLVAQYSTTGAANTWVNYDSCTFDDVFGDVFIMIGTRTGSGSASGAAAFDDLNVGICTP